MIKILEKLLNLIYIQPCYFCKSIKEDKILCSKCERKVHFLPPTPFRHEGETKIYACTIYDELPKKLIKDFKYHNKKQLSTIMAGLMYKYWKDINTNENYTVIPVPIHKQRLKERKYNHMDLTAKEFCKLTKYNLNTNFLIRTKDTKKQFNLKKQERIRNIKNAFDINASKQQDKNINIIILDDITSTGATISEIIKLLNKNGYYNITALAFSTPDIWN